MTTKPTGLPLDGMRVIEFTHMVMGPTCGMILADLGAEVIKIEPPGGDKTRKLPGLGIGFFRSFNRNKKSVVLDIKTPEGHAQRGRADRPVRRDARELPPGPDGQARPRLRDARRSAIPRLDLRLAQGLPAGPVREAPRARRGRADDGRPVVHDRAGRAGRCAPARRSTTSWAACSARSACSPRCASATRTGRGQEVQSALFENCVFLSAQHMQQFSMTQRTAAADAVARRRRGASTTSSRSPTASSSSSARSATSSSSTLCDVLGAPDLAGDPTLRDERDCASRSRPDAARTARRRSLRHHRVDELSPKLEAAGIPYAPIVRPDQLLDDPHLNASGGLVPMETDDGGTTDVVLLPLTMGGRRPGVRQAAAAGRRAQRRDPVALLADAARLRRSMRASPSSNEGRRDKVVSAADAVRLIRAGDTVATGGFVGIGFAEAIAVAIEAQHVDGIGVQEGDVPASGLTLVYAAGQGDGRGRGLNHLAPRRAGPARDRRPLGAGAEAAAARDRRTGSRPTTCRRA